MKRSDFIKKFILVIALLILSSFFIVFNNSTNELIRISKSGSLNIISITNKSAVSEIKNILSSIQYTQERLDVDLNKPDYTLWLENSKSSDRIFQVYLWVDTGFNKVIVFNTDSSEFGCVTEFNKFKLRKAIEVVKE